MKQKSKETFKAKYFPPVLKEPVTPAATSNAATTPLPM
jgi:hypothetical protein